MVTLFLPRPNEPGYLGFTPEVLSGLFVPVSVILMLFVLHYHWFWAWRWGCSQNLLLHMWLVSGYGNTAPSSPNWARVPGDSS